MRTRGSAPGVYPDGYRAWMVTKRSVSLSDSVAAAVEAAATEDGVWFSAWLTGAVECQLRIREGLRVAAALRRAGWAN